MLNQNSWWYENHSDPNKYSFTCMDNTEEKTIEEEKRMEIQNMYLLVTSPLQAKGMIRFDEQGWYKGERKKKILLIQQASPEVWVFFGFDKEVFVKTERKEKRKGRRGTTEKKETRCLYR